MINSWADVHKSCMVRCFPCTMTFLAEAVSIASSSLQQIQSSYISHFIIAILHFRSSCPELFFKIVVLKNFAKFIGVSSGTGASCEFSTIYILYFTVKQKRLHVYVLSNLTCLLVIIKQSCILD